MSMSMRSTAPPDPRPPRGPVPRWAWVLIAFLTIVATVAIVVAVTGSDDGDDNTAPASSAPPSPGPEQVADGCLGGVTDLDQAILDAQRRAPLTAEGAAEFTATLLRWAFQTPAPPRQAAIAPQILAGDATDKARRLSGTIDPEGTTSSFDFSDGRYYVESFDGSTAVVSYRASAQGTKDGQDVGPAIVGGGVHLRAVDGVWRYQDLTFTREIAEMERIGTRYAGGC